MDKNENVFKVSKSKATLTTLLSIGALASLAWIIYYLLVISSLSAYIKGIGLAACVFPILLAASYIFYGIKCLIGFGRGIIVNDKGLKIDIGTNNGYFISWAEITELTVDTKIYNPVHLLVFIDNPNKLVSETHGLQRIWLKMNDFLYKTPVNLTASALDCSFKTLLMSVCDRFYAYLTSQCNDELKLHVEALLSEYSKINREVKKVYSRLLKLILLFVLFYLVAFVVITILFW
jgi:hypothetical protein